mgnify:CR=1 FL=1
MTANEMTGGEVLARCLQAHGGGPMFGMGGFQLLPFYDAVRRLGMAHTLINDERCGVFAADAYAKLSGRVGLCDATLGPGATNLVTGLVEALNAGSPLVAVVGDTHRAHSWKNMTQETRQAEILRPACKELLRIERTERIPEFVRRAFAVATTGRPGPVVVIVPEDVCHDTHPFAPEDFVASERYQAAPAMRTRPDAEDLGRAAAERDTGIWRDLAQAQRQPASQTSQPPTSGWRTACMTGCQRACGCSWCLPTTGPTARVSSWYWKTDCIAVIVSPARSTLFPLAPAGSAERPVAGTTSGCVISPSARADRRELSKSTVAAVKPGVSMLAMLSAATRCRRASPSSALPSAAATESVAETSMLLVLVCECVGCRSVGEMVSDPCSGD